jgi:hypothetical protein
MTGSDDAVRVLAMLVEPAREIATALRELSKTALELEQTQRDLSVNLRKLLVSDVTAGFESMVYDPELLCRAWSSLGQSDRDAFLGMLEDTWLEEQSRLTALRRQQRETHLAMVEEYEQRRAIGWLGDKPR